MGQRCAVFGQTGKKGSFNKMRKVILPMVALGLLWAVSCSKNAPAPAGTMQSASSSNSPSSAESGQMLINGAGSTFDYPAFTKWFEAYAQVDSNVQFNYQSIGSGGGLRQFVAETVDFGASDAPMSDEMIAKAPGKPVHFPIVLGGEPLVYNLPGDPKLKLDADTVAGIYLGQITKWNDPKIAALNPSLNLPDLPVVVVHRSDGSGTTFIFVDYLSSVSATWASTVGKGTSVKWPVGLGGKGNEGVAGQVKQSPGAIGYVELAYAQENHMTYADLKNAAGNFVTPNAESVSAAMAAAKIPDDFRFSIVNAAGDKAYPISGASWVLIYQTQKDAAKGKKIVSFLKWALTDGQKYLVELGYAPLPDNVVQRELKMLDTVQY
jgi:phosphate transport system substrate-binding protein